MSVCLAYDNFRNSQPRKLTFGLRVYLHNEILKLAYQGHRVKVKVMAAKAKTRQPLVKGPSWFNPLLLLGCFTETSTSFTLISYSYSYRVSLLNNCSQRNHAVL